jgi:hypothetical protein
MGTFQPGGATCPRQELEDRIDELEAESETLQDQVDSNR